MIAHMEANDPLLVKLWPSIIDDKMYNDNNFCAGAEGADARHQFLANLPTDKVLNIKGPKIAPSKWFSWMMVHAEWDQHIHTQCLVKVALCLKQGWVRHSSDLWVPPDPVVVDDLDTGSSTLAVQPCESGAPIAGASSSSSVAIVPPGPAGSGGQPATRKKTPFQLAKEKYDKLRQKCANSIHSTTKLLCLLRLWDDTRIISMGASSKSTATTSEPHSWAQLPQLSRMSVGLPSRGCALCRRLAAEPLGVGASRFPNAIHHCKQEKVEVDRLRSPRGREPCGQHVPLHRLPCSGKGG